MTDAATAGLGIGIAVNIAVALIGYGRLKEGQDDNKAAIARIEGKVDGHIATHAALSISGPVTLHVTKESEP